VLGFIFLVVLQVPRQATRIIACEVGQGDAILIIQGSKQVLVDGGPSGEKVLACLARQMPYWDRTIELIVLTNTDFDHMNGLASVVERYLVMQFVTADGVHRSESLEKLSEALRRNRIQPVGVERGDRVRLEGNDKTGELSFDVLWPPQVENKYVAVLGAQMDEAEREQILKASAKRGDLNERSVVLLLTVGGYRALLMGDSGFQTENELLKEGLITNVDYLKVGHHGSKNSTGLELLQQARPEIAVISVGKNNYGHPTRETLDRLEKMGAKVKRTDLEGDIEVEIL